MTQTVLKNGLAIALDVDGTLVGRDGIVSERLKQALQSRWDDATFILASGRPPGGIHYIFDQIELSGHYVALNGGVVSPGPGQPPLHTNPFTKAQIEALVALVKSTDMVAAVLAYEADSWGFWGSKEWAAFEGDVLNLPADRAYASLEELIERPVIQMSLTVDEAHHQRLLRDAAQAALPDTLHVNEPVPQFVEVIRTDAQKSDGLKILAEHLGLTRIIAVGDSDNDLAMVQYADVGYAMPHAAPVLKSVADIIIDEPAFDSLADLVARLFDEQL